MNMKIRMCLPSMLTQAVFYLWCLSLLIRDPPHCGAPVWQPPTCDSLKWGKRGGWKRDKGWKEGEKEECKLSGRIVARWWWSWWWRCFDSMIIANPVQFLWYSLSFMTNCTLFFMLSQDCRLAKIWLSIAWTHSSLSSYVDASKFHVWPVNDTITNSKESSCSGKQNKKTHNKLVFC